MSVVIPVFNRSALLGRALVSVFNQSVDCEEIIVVDDGSTDGSLDSLAVLSKNYQGSKIRVFSQRNKGPAAARNLGLKMARCETIAFLDSDDHWRRKKLEIQYNILKGEPEYLISHTLERWLRNGRHLNQRKRHVPRHGAIFDHCLELCAVGMSTVMLKKNLISEVGLFDESMRCCEDYDFWLRISCRHPFLLVTQALTIKEGGREDQVSFQYRTGMDRFRIDSLLRLVNSERLSDSQRLQAQRELLQKCRVYGKGCLKHGNITEGNRCLALITAFENTSSICAELP